MPTPFANEPILELRRSAVRNQLAEALAGIDRELPLSVPVLVGADARSGAELVSTDPGAPDRVVGNAARATTADVDAAVAEATRGRATWGATPAADRAAALIAAAAWLRERRLRIAALQVRECAKPWPEADADVCEAIDFLEYYARLALELDRGRPLLQVPGERNELRYVPRGVVAVISPWNFPLAIPCGMTSAALAAGNAVVLKPAEQSPALAYQLVQALRAGGVPPEAISFLPGEGDAGAALVAHPDVHAIAFTGSLAVGREIVAGAAQVRDWAAPLQAGGGRARRQELRDRRLRRRPGRGGARDRRLGVQLCGPEVLGGLARAGPRGDRRPRCWSGWPVRCARWWWDRRRRWAPTCRR